MRQKVDVYTETMAKVYADQGHWGKAVEIYRHLLAMEPERLDFADALAEAENRLKEMSRKTPEQLVPLFREWIELLFKSEALQKLKKLKKGH
jgi:tetratricopeptide (TPR) repeat protein